MKRRAEYAVVMTTTSGERAAAALARKILSKKLGACIQILNIRSVYGWKGKACDDPECLLLIKTRADLYEKLEAFIRANHAYETPEITLVPIEKGWGKYLDWIDEVTGKKKKSRGVRS